VQLRLFILFFKKLMKFFKKIFLLKPCASLVIFALGLNQYLCGVEIALLR